MELEKELTESNLALGVFDTAQWDHWYVIVRRERLKRFGSTCDHVEGENDGISLKACCSLVYV